MPGSGRREWGHPGQAHAPAGPLRRARQASSLKSILPAHVIRNAASCPVCVERRHSSSSHRRSLRPKSPPQAGGGAARAVPGQSERKAFSGRTASEERLPRMQKNLRPGKRRRFFVFFQKRAPTALYLWESRCRWGRTGPRSSGRPCQEPWPGP